MSNVILGGRKPRWRCSTPTGPEGQVCGLPFYEGEERQLTDHIAKCASDNRRWIENRSVRHNLSELYDGTDLERRDYVYRTGDVS